jgi:ABC-type dipeptide/oligopeptide/nickel transport system permease component
MLLYLLRRLGGTLLTLWVAVTIAFFALRIIPGDALAAQLARGGANPQQIAARRAELGLDQPAVVQYVQTIAGLLRGNLGLSIATQRPVADVVGEQFGATINLAVGALVVATFAGVGLGIVMATSRSALTRGSAAVVVALILSSPVYWTGTLAIYVFSVGLGWLPSTGGGDLRHLILPWLALGLSLSGGIARVTAASLDEIRTADFVRTARAKGLPEQRIIVDHMLRAGLGPILAVIALQTGFLVGGAVVTEALFVRQGIGQVLVNAILDKDFPVVQGIVILSALVYSLVNTGADLFIAALDSRVRLRDAAS